MSRSDTLFLSLLCALIGAVLGWSLATRTTDHACQDLLESTYKAARSAGKNAGLAEAQQNGSCLKWWTGTSTEGLQAAKNAFCKQR
jgi:uncharacterized protein (DUF2252 family)